MRKKGLVNVRFEGPPWFLVDPDTTYVDPTTGYLNEGNADVLCSRVEGVRAVFLFTSQESASICAENIPGHRFVPAKSREPKHCVGLLESAQGQGNTHVVLDFMGITPEEEANLGPISELVGQIKAMFVARK